MQFTAKWNGQPPTAQNQVILFSDCDTNQPVAEAPNNLLPTVTQPWITATFLAPNQIRVAVNQSGMAVGMYTGTVNVKIPDDETCEVGSVFAIAVEMIVKKGKVKFA